MNREIRIFRYLVQNPGFQPRDNIMHWTGFPSPKAQPVSAYVEFHNALMRLNGRIRRMGYEIVGGRTTGEQYQIVSAKREAA